jgi:translation initiation factor 2B subunit (eIF-2B alpha/beta/delta family)
VRGEDLRSATTIEEFWRDFRMVGWHLAKNGRTSMGAAIEAAVFGVMDSVSAELRRSVALGGIELSSFKSITERSIEARMAARRHSLDALGKFFEQFIARAEGHRKEDKTSSTTIVTLSSSSTTTKCLTDLIQNSTADEMNINLSILESRPMFEGVAFANALLNSLEKGQGERGTLSDYTSRLKIEIFTDASVAMAVKAAHYIVLGADKISPNGDVSNKIGSLAAAALAKTLQPSCAIVVVSETDKITGEVDDAERLKVEYNDETEVTKAWPSGYAQALQERQEMGYELSVKNAYFEWIPAAYIDGYVSEEGLLTVQDITRLSKEKAELEDRIFGDL